MFTASWNPFAEWCLSLIDTSPRSGSCFRLASSRVFNKFEMCANVFVQFTNKNGPVRDKMLEKESGNMALYMFKITYLINRVLLCSLLRFWRLLAL